MLKHSAFPFAFKGLITKLAEDRAVPFLGLYLVEKVMVYTWGSSSTASSPNSHSALPSQNGFASFPST